MTELLQQLDVAIRANNGGLAVELADKFSLCGQGEMDGFQFLPLARRRLALCEKLNDLPVIVYAHLDLAECLEGLKMPSAHTEAQLHRLAALAYCCLFMEPERLYVHLINDYGGADGMNETKLRKIRRRVHNAFQSSFSRYGDIFIPAFRSGMVPFVPRLEQLLNDPAFLTLQAWLCRHCVSADDLQHNLDRRFDTIGEIMRQTLG
ncbi:MAG: hypothetical protein V4726_25230 [Verrucomicrobiota bacterium]